MRRLAAVVALVASVLAITAPAHAAKDPNAYTASETFITSADGTKLHTRVYRPARLGPDDRTPVILNAGPYAGSGGSLYFSSPTELTSSGIPGPGGFAEDARVFERGYTFMTVGLRGYGGSGGCYDFGGPGEQSDVKAAVEWAASRPWSTGKVGMIGHSYEGEAQLMALRTKPKGLAAVIPSAPPSGYRNLYTNGVRNFGGGTAFTAFYAGSDAYPPSLFAPTAEWQESLTGTATHPTCYADVTAGSYASDPNDRYWTDRDLVGATKRTSVPVFLVHGFNDFNVRTSNILPEFSRIHAPRRAILGPWDHGIPRIGKRWAREEIRWLDHWLKGTPLPDAPSVLVQDIKGRWRAEENWPPADASPWTMKLNAGSYLNGPGNNAETGLPDAFGVTLPIPLPTGRGLWTFTQPLAGAVHLAGQSTITARVSKVSPNANVITLVYDVDEDDNAHFVERGAFLAPESGTFHFSLYPQDWRFEAGHRIGVLLTGADDIWFEPNGVVSPVTVEAASLRMPVLRNARTAFVRSGPFAPRTPHPPFHVDPQTIASSTRTQTLPPPMAAHTGGTR